MLKRFMPITMRRCAYPDPNFKYHESDRECLNKIIAADKGAGLQEITIGSRACSMILGDNYLEAVLRLMLRSKRREVI